MFQHTLFAKKSRLNNTALFLDFDGTIFTPDKKIITAPFYNRQTKRIIDRNQIPLIIVTGRSAWTRKSDIELMLLGLPKPDAVIAGAGSIIYYRLPNSQLALDTSWEKHMQQTKIQGNYIEKTSWNREEILKNIHPLLPTEVQIFPHTAADTYLIRFYVRDMSITKLMEVKKIIETRIPIGIRVIFTEKLLQENTIETFSGNILIVPSTAGKENAVKYILKILPTINQVFCFGDATIDVPMLTMKSDPKKYTMHTYGVNLTPLAKKSLTDAVKQNPQLNIIDYPHSPQAILEIVKTNPLFARKKSGIAKIKNQITSNKLSPAQNTPARLLLKPFESFLDTFFDQNLTADQISFKGLEMLKQSIDLFYAKQGPYIFGKLTIWKLYAIGNLTDIFDGIRARQTNTISNEGQLTDVFCDRAKEFYQLYKRAEKRLPQNQQKGYQTFLTAISCILPSIARAQAEFSGTIVKEQDVKGGSMLARTRKLFCSFFFETLGLHQESLAIDQSIYTANIATYQNRISKLHIHDNFLFLKEKPALEVRRSEKFISRSNINNTLQQKALERFLLLVQLLQEENALIKKALQEYPTLIKKYEKEFTRYIEKYLKADIGTLRQSHKIQTSQKLSLYK